MKHALVVAFALLMASVVAVPMTPIAGAASSSSSYESDLAVLINQYRVRHQLPALALDTSLTTLAREHSTAMARNARMSHDGMPSRVRRSGSGMCVENVGWNYASPREQFDGWRASAGHNQNMLDRRVARMGIGVVDGYVTQIACGT